MNSKSCGLNCLMLVAGVAMFAASTRADSPDSRNVDAVSAGDEQNERDHKLKGEQTDTQRVNDRVLRFANTNGWFSWVLKARPDVQQELYIECGGGRRAAPDVVQIFINDEYLDAVRLNGGGPAELYWPLKLNLVDSRSNVTLMFKAPAGRRVGGVYGASISTLPPPTIASMSKASSPRTNYQFIVNAINDQHEPKSSGDRGKRHFDWWPAKGTNQRVQYDFAKPARVSTVEVYWFDDTGIGECRLPKSWQVMWRENGEWKPVTHPGGYGCEGNRYNRTTFDAVETDGLRLDVVLPERFSSGLLQWKVE